MSANVWSILGVAPAADVRAIKRAYGARLKTCRPDDDAEGFAHLRTAYEMALAHAENMARQHLAQAADEPQAGQAAANHDTAQSSAAHSKQPAMPLVPAAGSIAVPPVSALPRQHHEQIVQPATVGQAVLLANEIVERSNAESSGPDPLQSWLQTHPDLISLQQKALVSHELVKILMREFHMRRPAFEVLYHFFDWGDRQMQQQLARSGLSIQAVIERVETETLRHWMATGLARKYKVERMLEDLRVAEPSRKARLLNSQANDRTPLPFQLNKLMVKHGYRAVENVFGAGVMEALANHSSAQSKKQQAQSKKRQDFARLSPWKKKIILLFRIFVAMLCLILLVSLIAAFLYMQFKWSVR